MARCMFCDKGTTTGRKLSINRSQVSKRAKRTVKPNIQTVRVDNGNGETIKLNLCTHCLRNLQRTKGL